MAKVESQKRSKEEMLALINEYIGEQVPIEVVDYEAYYEYLKLNNNPIHSLKIQIGDKEVPITHPIPVFNRMLNNAVNDELMSPEKAESHKKLKNKQMAIKLKAMAQLKVAYGTVVNKNGEKIVYKTVFEPVKEQMIELFGRMFTQVEVHEICLKTWKLPCTVNQISDFRKFHIVEINKRIEEHKRTYSDIRLGHKRSRLEEYVWLYNKRKKIYEISGKGEDHRILLQTLEQIRKEAEGDSLRIDGNVNFGLDVTINNHIQQDLRKTMPLKEIIISRIAARTNSDPTKLLGFLSQSIYRNVLDAETVEFEEMPDYPSSQNYDFDRIKSVNEESARQKILEAKPIQSNSEAISEGEMLKRNMIALLAKKQGDVNREVNNLSNEYHTES